MVTEARHIITETKMEVPVQFQAATTVETPAAAAAAAVAYHSTGSTIAAGHVRDQDVELDFETDIGPPNDAHHLLGNHRQSLRDLGGGSPSFCARFARSCWVRQSKQVVPALLMLACTVPVLVALTAFIATFLREDTGALVRAELYASAFAGAAEGLLFVVMVLWPQIEVVVLLVSIWSAYQDEAAVVDFVIWFYNFVRVPVYSTHS
jgi:hypothetical protein